MIRSLAFIQHSLDCWGSAVAPMALAILLLFSPLSPMVRAETLVQARGLETAQFTKVEDGSVSAVTSGPGEATALPSVAVSSETASRIIVRLKGSPLAPLLARRAHGELPAAMSLASEESGRLEMLRRLADDVAQLENAVRAAAGLDGVKSADLVRREYTRVLLGAALKVSRETVRAIEQLDYVEEVRPDVEMRASLADSAPLIGASALWSSSGAKGEGMRVAVIDTGVDYGHMDLGGCFGPGCKVSDGWDFVNNDADPMDDHGHGTHCAGIVAADSAAAQGVAPKAEILAYKVLNAAGGGYSSDIIAAIERSVDPDQDILTDDAVDVASLSLGGPGHPDDPTSLAVDAAVAAGVVVTVAAGNDYNYHAVGSPGAARDAITVGASDDADVMAAFSSKGPVGEDHAIKPDLTAPGVSICSSQWADAWSANQCLDDEHTAISGTSMATPHVAGAAALLLQLHPDWSPARIKAALMETSLDLGYDPYVQGSGRIRVDRAAAAQGLVQPASLSLGLCDLSQSSWVVTRAVRLENLSDSARTYALSLEESPTPGVVISFDPEGPIVAPAGESVSVEVSLSVDTAQVPNKTAAPYAYTGRLLFSSTGGDGEVLPVPWAFVKSPTLRLRLDENPWNIWVHNGQNVSRSTNIAEYGGEAVDFLLPSGTYDVVVGYQPYGESAWVVREGVVLEDFKELNIAKAEAVHEVRVQAQDFDGAPISLDPWVTLFSHRPSGGFIQRSSGSFFYFNGLTRFNDISDNYSWEFVASTRYVDPVVYKLQNGLRGMNQSLTLLNDPAEFETFDLSYHARPTDASLTPLHFVSTVPQGTFVLASANYNIHDPPLTRPLSQTIHWQRAPFEDFGLYLQIQGYTPNAQTGQRLFISSTCGLDSAGLVSSYALFRPEPLDQFGAGSWDIDGPLLHFSGLTRNESTKARVFAALGYLGYIYRDAGGTTRQTMYPAYTLYDENGDMVSNGTMTRDNGLQGVNWTVSLPSAGKYVLEIEGPVWTVAGSAGQGATRLKFDSRLADPDPPVLWGFGLEAGDGGTRLASFTVTDEALADARLWYRIETSEWTAVPLSEAGDVYSANLPRADGAVCLALEAEDASGNLLRYELNPAYGGRRGGAPIHAFRALLMQ